jgi:hypothetical protein
MQCSCWCQIVIWTIIFGHFEDKRSKHLLPATHNLNHHTNPKNSDNPFINPPAPLNRLMDTPYPCARKQISDPLVLMSRSNPKSSGLIYRHTIKLECQNIFSFQRTHSVYLAVLANNVSWPCFPAILAIPNVPNITLKLLEAWSIC